MEKKKGRLILVPTPLGNPEDMSPRARRILTECDRVAAEDTRSYAQLCRSLSLPEKPSFSYHEHNEKSREALALELLERGENLVQLSDAGMPAISDPGQRLVAAAREAGYDVTALPGPNAAITALAASGLSTRRFHFEGFLPASGSERTERLARLAEIPDTVILYEAPHRLLRTLSDLETLGLGERRLCVARELSKRFEEYVLSSLRAAREKAEDRAPRGEHVLILEGKEAFFQRCPCCREEAERAAEDRLRSEIAAALAAGRSAKDIRRELKGREGLSRNRLYALIEEAQRAEESQ